MIYYIYHHIIPATYALLPSRMNTPQASAMLLAIGLQESRFKHREQVGGPARGFWQFERGGGVAGVLNHPSTADIALNVMRGLQYPINDNVLIRNTAVYVALAHNDVLACALARLLLWTYPARLPESHEVDMAWTQYLDLWRPGKPREESWAGCYERAWREI